MNWNEVVTEYLESAPFIGEELRKLLESLSSSGMVASLGAISPDVAAASKGGSSEFVVSAIACALRDHALTENEVRDLKTLQRVLRIKEGDLVEHHRSKVADVLCREAELMFEDHGVSREDEVNKARLQEVLGLGYDEFMDFLKPEIEQLHRGLMDRARSGTRQTWLGTAWQEIRDRLNALSLARFSQWLGENAETTAGYIYLLVNPSMPGLVKVGRTGQPPSRRATALGGATGVPTPFEVVFEVLVPDQRAAEAYVHRALEERGCRVSGNREFFAVQPDEVIRLMVDVHDRMYLGGTASGAVSPNVS